MFPCLYICIYPSVYTSSLPVYLSSPSRLLNFSWKFMEVDATLCLKALEPLGQLKITKALAGPSMIFLLP